MKWVRAITVTAAGLALGAVAACGTQGEAVSGVAVTDQAQAQVDAGAPQVQAAPGDNQAAAVTSKLAVATAGGLGQIIVDGDGRSLYRFDGDVKGQPSKCVGDCAVAWPPLMATDAATLQVEGIEKGLIATAPRDDGSQQVTIGGWPAYHYSKDTQAGDTKGQGAGGKWFAFKPDSKKAADATAAPSVSLVLMKVGNLGQIVTDAAGMTLYRFDKDTKGVKSNCDGECAAKWPPVIVPEGAQIQTNGVDQANVTTITRSDGSKQIAVGGWPLYRFAGDAKPCDINGQGVGGTWFASTATGGKAKAGGA